MPVTPTPLPGPAIPPPKPRSAAQIAASRRNGARSKGPVSEEGKARSRMNGLVHGLTAQLAHLLPVADEPGFATVKAGVLASGSEFVRAAELDQLAGALWLRTRATALEMAVLSGLHGQVMAGAFRPGAGAAGADGNALDAAADLQLRRLLLFARYATRIRRELDRLMPARSGAERPVQPAGSGSLADTDANEINGFSGSLGNLQPPPPLPTEPEEGRALRRMNLEVLGVAGTDAFVLEQLQQQEARHLPLVELLAETDLTLAFWQSDGVDLVRVRLWRDRLARRIAAAGTAPPPIAAGAAASAGPAPAIPEDAGVTAARADEPSLDEVRLPAPLAPETLEEQVLRLFREPVPRAPGDLALADSLVANLCYRRTEAHGTIRLFDLLDVIDRLRAQGRLPHPDVLNRLAGDAFATAYAALLAPARPPTRSPARELAAAARVDAGAGGT